MHSYNTRFSCKMTYAILKARTNYESLNVRFLGAKERGMQMNDHQLNSPLQHLNKHIENSMENMHSDVTV